MTVFMYVDNGVMVLEKIKAISKIVPPMARKL